MSTKTNARMLMRRGLNSTFDKNELEPGEFAVPTDTNGVYVCKTDGNVERLVSENQVQEIVLDTTGDGLITINLRNTVVPISAFTDKSGVTTPKNYPFYAFIPSDYCFNTSFVQVYPTSESIDLDVLSDECDSVDGGFYIYAKSVPTKNITIDLISIIGAFTNKNVLNTIDILVNKINALEKKVNSEESERVKALEIRVSELEDKFVKLQEQVNSIAGKSGGSGGTKVSTYPVTQLGTTSVTVEKEN